MNTVATHCFRCITVIAISAAAFADVTPVPTSVIPEKMEDAKPRNVVFILSDDHRYDAMSFMGHPFAKTPHMDAMAKNGAHLKNAFVTTSLCSPSRASILTGLYTFRHRVIDNQRAVPDGTLFFPQYLQQAGYKTGFIGKWHMGHANDDPRPGFDYWFSFKGQGQYYPPGPNYTINDNGKRVPQDGYITTLLTRKAVEFLEQTDRDKPFFLYLSHKAVHGPFTPEPKYDGSLEKYPFKLPESGKLLTDNKFNRPRWLLDQRNSWHGIDFPLHTGNSVEVFYKSYCEALRSVDDSIGVVTEQLQKMGIHDETLVIYMGDNGYMFGEHGLIDKRVAYETSSRVPMLMQCPEIIDGGTVVDHVVANIDIAPTVMQAMGLKKPAHMDGQSFLPLAQGQTSLPWRDYFLYCYYWEQNYPQTPTHFSLRGDQYKYTTYYGLWDTDELFDIQADPMEQNNLIHDPEFANIKQQMQDRLYTMMDDLGGMEIPLNPPRGRQQNKRLRDRGGEEAANFPRALIVDEPLRKELK